MKIIFVKIKNNICIDYMQYNVIIATIDSSILKEIYTE